MAGDKEARAETAALLSLCAIEDCWCYFRFWPLQSSTLLVLGCPCSGSLREKSVFLDTHVPSTMFSPAGMRSALLLGDSWVREQGRKRLGSWVPGSTLMNRRKTTGFFPINIGSLCNHCEPRLGRSPCWSLRVGFLHWYCLTEAQVVCIFTFCLHFRLKFDPIPIMTLITTIYWVLSISCLSFHLALQPPWR